MAVLLSKIPNRISMRGGGGGDPGRPHSAGPELKRKAGSYLAFCKALTQPRNKIYLIWNCL